MDHNQLSNQSSIINNSQGVIKAKVDKSKDNLIQNEKYFTPERIKKYQIGLNQKQKLIRSFSNKNYITKTEQSFSNQNELNDTAASSNQNMNSNKQIDKNQDINSSRNQNQFRNTDMQQHFNKQISKKLSYCINFVNQKEIYPSKITAMLKNQQTQDPSYLLRKKEEYIKDKSSLIDKKRNSQNNDNNISQRNNESSIENIKKINNFYQQNDDIQILNQDIQQKHIDMLTKDIQIVDKYKLSNENRIVNKGNIKILRMQSQEQLREKNNIKNKEINNQDSNKQNENLQLQTQYKKIQIQLLRKRIPQSLDHKKFNDLILNKPNTIETFKNDNRIDSIQTQSIICSSEQRIKIDSSQQDDFTTKTCSLTNKPEFIQNNYIPLKQRSLSKKLLEKIKINRHYQDNHQLTKEETQLVQPSESNYNLNNNQQITQQQQINRYAEYIKYDCYILNQELRPNKPKVKLLVESILKMYQFFLSLSQERERISKIMKECGATKGRLKEIFFLDSNSSQSPKQEDIYQNKLSNNEKLDWNKQINNNIEHESQDTSNKKQSPNLETDLKLVENLNPKDFYNKTYFKILQNDKNGVVYVQEYIDLQVIEDLDNLKTTLSFCLKYTEEDSSQKTVPSISSSTHSQTQSQTISIKQEQNQNVNYYPINIIKDQSNIQKNNSPFELKINTYEENKSIIKMKYPIKKELKQSNKNNANENRLKEQTNKSNIKLYQNTINNQQDDTFQNGKEQNERDVEEDVDINEFNNTSYNIKQKDENIENIKNNYNQTDNKVSTQIQQNNTQQHQIEFQTQQDDMLDFIYLLKDSRFERKGIISEIREFSQINEGIKIPQYTTGSLSFDINNCNNYNLSNYF